MKFIFVAMISLFLTNCKHSSSAESTIKEVENSSEENKEVENGVAQEIFGFRPDSEGVTFYVSSGGCIGKDEFEIKLSGDSPKKLRLVTKVAPGCEAYYPYGQKLKYTWKELGLQAGDKFVLDNKIQASVD